MEEQKTMRIIKTIDEIRSVIKAHKKNGHMIGFVPTMGALHEGHLTLLKKAREENQIVVLSIFVNPLQFGPNEDFDSYPRDFKHDEGVAKNTGVDIIFYPETTEMYKKPMSISVSVNDRVDVLCGRKREGHFDGVATVLMKLFHIVQPDKAYFGMKDAQQVAVVDSLIQDFNFPIELIPVPTVREEDGLAKSSRNVYLSDAERLEAPVLFQSLQKAKEAVENGERNTEKVISIVESYIKNNTQGQIDYVEIYSYPELKSIEYLENKIIIALAVKYTKARLIDNIILEV